VLVLSGVKPAGKNCGVWDYQDTFSSHAFGGPGGINGRSPRWESIRAHLQKGRVNNRGENEAKKIVV